MLLKIFTAKRDVEETADTGTYADGYLLPETGPSDARRQMNERSSHERDYGTGRKVASLPVGFA